MIGTSDLDNACNSGIPNGDIPVIMTGEGKSLIGKCRTCYNLSEYHSNSHDCTVGYEVLNLQEAGLHPDTHGCEEWESVDDE